MTENCKAEHEMGQISYNEKKTLIILDFIV